MLDNTLERKNSPAHSMAVSRGHRFRQKFNQRNIAPYLFLAPFIILFTVFFAWPVLYSLYMSFLNSQGLGGSTFVGLKNYVDLLKDERFIKSVVNTTYYALGSVFVISPLALFIALAFHSKFTKWKNFYKAVYFLPVITSAVVVTIMFNLVFDYRYGLLNTGLQNIGISGLPWLESTKWAMPAIIIMGVWNWVGINALYFLAGLQAIPVDLYEAATVDGAKPAQRFVYITLPMLRQVTLFVVVQAIIGSYMLFAQPFLLTQGGPEDATLTVAMYLYVQGFQNFNSGYASAIGYILLLIIFLLTLIQLLLFRVFKED